MIFALLGVALVFRVAVTSAQGTLGGPTDELLLWYKLDEASGTTAADSSGNGFTGTRYTGNGYFATYGGVNYYDAYTNQGDTGIRLPTAFITAFLRANNYTLTLHYSGGSHDDPFFRLDHGAYQVDWRPDTGAANNKAQFKVTGTSTDTIQSGTAVLSSAPYPIIWSHYAVTYQKGKVYKMYLNGQVVATLTTPINNALRTIPATASPSVAHLGCVSQNYATLQGIYRDFRVYNRTLTQNEIIAVAYASPTMSPTLAPTPRPTDRPTLAPTSEPTRIPSLSPSQHPTVTPTRLPTVTPTLNPTQTPTVPPTVLPTQLPSTPPTTAPTSVPTQLPTQLPTTGPTQAPTRLPTQLPSTPPSTSPSTSPTALPTTSPTVTITVAPTMGPSVLPTRLPTLMPSMRPSTGPTRSPTGMPTSLPTLLPTAPTVEPTLAPTQAPTKGRWDALVVAGRKVKKSCAYQSGPALGPMGLTLGVLLLSVCVGSYYSVDRKRGKVHSDSEAELQDLAIVGRQVYSAEAIAMRKMNLAMGIKVFWGGSTSILNPTVLVPNPLKLEDSAVCTLWKQDLSYHVCNHAWLPSMCFADPLDAVGGPWGHRAAFLLLGMLLFAMASVLALYEHKAGRALHVGLVLLALLISAALACGLVSRLCRGLFLGFCNENYVRNDLPRQAKVNSGLTCLALLLWAVFYALVYKHSECGSSVLPLRVLVLWLALVVVALAVDLPLLVNRYLPRHRSFKVYVCGMPVLRLNVWKKQVIVRAFHSHTRLPRGPFRDLIKDWRENYQANPAFVVEFPAFEKAISFCHYRLWPLLLIVEFDVPTELRDAFLKAPEILNAGQRPIEGVLEPAFHSTKRVAQVAKKVEQEEMELVRRSKLGSLYSAVVAFKRHTMKLAFDHDVDDDFMTMQSPTRHVHSRAVRYEADMGDVRSEGSQDDLGDSIPISPRAHPDASSSSYGSPRSRTAEVPAAASPRSPRTNVAGTSEQPRRTLQLEPLSPLPRASVISVTTRVRKVAPSTQEMGDGDGRRQRPSPRNAVVPLPMTDYETEEEEEEEDRDRGSARRRRSSHKASQQVAIVASPRAVVTPSRSPITSGARRRRSSGDSFQAQGRRRAGSHVDEGEEKVGMTASGGGRAADRRGSGARVVPVGGGRVARRFADEDEEDDTLGSLKLYRNPRT